MNKKTVSLILILFTAAAFLTGCRHVSISNPLNKNGGSVRIPVLNTTANTAFHEVTVNKIGNHTYLADNFYTARNRNNAEQAAIEACLTDADKSLKDDLYVFGVGEIPPNGDYIFYGKGYTDGVILEEITYSAKTTNGTSYTWERIDLTTPVPVFDKNTALPASEFYDTVFKLATEHKKQMFFSGYEKPISGEYELKAGIREGLYYEFRINEYSSVKVDAQSGRIIQQYFWNGVYID